ncbi:hypothetical Protein YC6258_00048 [Gynuella sunshinyii YC6258]|uniref:Uncharacterized protein n=1 Tax=Gynuella sunshinyii YC6258 TaxID=1445510 RepID=A0A0C5VPB8_9GAMM|nr:hypothetical Protein YC6258_00048 [Gynuella sunshinyii YC6258]
MGYVAVIVGASESELGRLEDLLKDKGLENIAVWGFQWLS